nr:MAG TPA: hypothetical protein [Herelleviridae sp.]
MKSCVRIAQPDARGLPVDVDEHGQQLAVKLFQQRPDHLALRRGTRCLQHVGVHHERRQQLGYHGPGQWADGRNAVIHDTAPAVPPLPVVLRTEPDAGERVLPPPGTGPHEPHRIRTGQARPHVPVHTLRW